MSEWITDPGAAHCQFCETEYHLETGYYCWSCDLPLCTTCVVTLLKPRQVLCPECAKLESDQGEP